MAGRSISGHPGVRHRGQKVVVLDDAPTGTQTVRDIPVLTDWSVETLRAEFANDLTAFFLLTDSRSLRLPAAAAPNTATPPTGSDWPRLEQANLLATFGYRASNLRAWVAEKTGGRLAAEAITAVALQGIRWRAGAGGRAAARDSEGWRLYRECGGQPSDASAPARGPQLRLRDIQHAVSVPLVLRGASGLPEDMVRRAIALGVCKFNVNTEVREAYIRALRCRVQGPTSADLLDLMREATSAMQIVVADKLRLFATDSWPS